MIFRCPGQDNRRVFAGPITCPGCGYVAEIFSDEARVKCPRCGRDITKECLPSCVNWCKHARECIGEERWKSLGKQEK